MEEPYIEGLATHGDPESCAAVREGRGEALTGARMGWVWSREINSTRVPTPFLEAEGNTEGAAIARHQPTGRGPRPHAHAELSCARNGRSLVCPSRMERRAASGRPEGRSR